MPELARVQKIREVRIIMKCMLENMRKLYFYRLLRERTKICSHSSITISAWSLSLDIHLCATLQGMNSRISHYHKNRGSCTTKRARQWIIIWSWISLQASGTLYPGQLYRKTASKFWSKSYWMAERLCCKRKKICKVTLVFLLIMMYSLKGFTRGKSNQYLANSELEAATSSFYCNNIIP